MDVRDSVDPWSLCLTSDVSCATEMLRGVFVYQMAKLGQVSICGGCVHNIVFDT